MRFAPTALLVLGIFLSLAHPNNVTLGASLSPHKPQKWQYRNAAVIIVKRERGGWGEAGQAL